MTTSSRDARGHRSVAPDRSALLAVVLYPLVWMLGALVQAQQGDHRATWRCCPTSPRSATTRRLDGISTSASAGSSSTARCHRRRRRRRQLRLLLARRVRLRPAAVPPARNSVRADDRHAAAAVPRAARPAVHRVPAARLDRHAPYLPLIVPKFLATEAFFVFLMVQFMRGLPRELDEAARIDGCGHRGSSGRHPAAEPPGPRHHARSSRSSGPGTTSSAR